MDLKWRSSLMLLLCVGCFVIVGICLPKCEASEKGLDVESEDGKGLPDDEDLSFLDDEDDEEGEYAEDEDENELHEGEFTETFEDSDSDSDFEGGFGGDAEDREGEEDPVQFDEKDVVVLSSGDFSDFLKSNTYVLVEFYAPWCGHCQSLAPEYADAATKLKGEAVLAKVDATANEDLAQEHGVESYPTLKFFIDGVGKPYTGHRRSDDIVKWVKRKTGPTVLSITSKDEAEQVLDAHQQTMAIAYFDSLKDKEVEEFASAARQDDNVLFFQTESAEVADVINFPKDLKRPALVLLKDLPEKISWFDGLFVREAIANFVQEKKLPLVITFKKDTASLIFESPIKKQLLLFVNPDDYKRLLPAYEEASKALKGKLVFVHVDMSDTDVGPGVVEFFGIPGDKPAIMGYETVENGRKFHLEDELTAESIIKFGTSFLAETLTPFMKSDAIPEKNDDDVKIVVGKSLETIVLDETKDALLEVYAPWCGHCQALEPIWNKLGNRLKGVDSIVVAKMDGTKNEHVRVKMDGFPTILFFPAGKKSFDPIYFDGNRTVKEFLKFLKKNAGIPFVIPKKKVSSTASSVENSKSEESSEESSRVPDIESVKLDPLEYVKDEL